MAASDPMAAFLKALDEFDDALEETVAMIQTMKERCGRIRSAHTAGIQLRDIVSAEDSPLLVQMLTRTTDLMQFYGNRVRRTEARALYAQGMTMEEIATLFGVTRQRVSALLRNHKAES
jgi:hypothetical protein